jgi:hypothetical protein
MTDENFIFFSCEKVYSNGATDFQGEEKKTKRSIFSQIISRWQFFNGKATDSRLPTFPRKVCSSVLTLVGGRRTKTSARLDRLVSAPACTEVTVEFDVRHLSACQTKFEYYSCHPFRAK